MRNADFTSFSLFLSQAIWLKAKHKSEVQRVSCVTIRSVQKNTIILSLQGIKGALQKTYSTEQGILKSKKKSKKREREYFVMLLIPYITAQRATTSCLFCTPPVLAFN
jgi:hypothetical protein